MAVIRCKLTKNGKSITSAEIQFESGDTIQFEPGQQPHFAEGSSSGELSVHVGEATLQLSLRELPNMPPCKRNPHTPHIFLVVGPDPGPGAAPTNPNDPPPKNPPTKHLSAVLVPDASATAPSPGAKGTAAG